MKAKDTVMADGLIENIADIAWDEAEVPEGQNELSHLYRELASRIAIAKSQAEISFKAGKKEVVDTLKDHPDFYKKMLGNSPDWQAKLKEWGIE